MESQNQSDFGSTQLPKRKHWTPTSPSLFVPIVESDQKESTEHIDLALGTEDPRFPEWGDDRFRWYDEVLSKYEADFATVSAGQSESNAEWWDHHKQDISNQITRLRSQIDLVRLDGPEAIGELREGMPEAMALLTESYRRKIREIPGDVGGSLL